MNVATESVYYENAIGRLLEHPRGYAVVEYQPGARQPGELELLLRQLAQLLTRRRLGKVLIDQRQMLPFTPAESEWLSTHWLRRSETFHGAIVLPHDVFARLASSQLVLEAKSAALSYRLFEDHTAAEAWLLTLP